MVLSGENKKKKGKVLSVDIKSQRAFVEGINIVSKHTKPNAKNPDGGIVKVEAPVHVSKLMLVDSKGVPSRVSKVKGKDGKIVRVSKKSKEEIK